MNELVEYAEKSRNLAKVRASQFRVAKLIKNAKAARANAIDMSRRTDVALYEAIIGAWDVYLEARQNPEEFDLYRKAELILTTAEAALYRSDKRAQITIANSTETQIIRIVFGDEKEIARYQVSKFSTCLKFFAAQKLATRTAALVMLRSMGVEKIVQAHRGENVGFVRGQSPQFELAKKYIRAEWPLHKLPLNAIAPNDSFVVMLGYVDDKGATHFVETLSEPDGFGAETVERIVRSKVPAGRAALYDHSNVLAKCLDLAEITSPRTRSVWMKVSETSAELRVSEDHGGVQLTIFATIPKPEWIDPGKWQMESLVHVDDEERGLDSGMSENKVRDPSGSRQPASRVLAKILRSGEVPNKTDADDGSFTLSAAGHIVHFAPSSRSPEMRGKANYRFKKAYGRPFLDFCDSVLRALPRLRRVSGFKPGRIGVWPDRRQLELRADGGADCAIPLSAEAEVKEWSGDISTDFSKFLKTMRKILDLGGDACEIGYSDEGVIVSTSFGETTVYIDIRVTHSRSRRSSKRVA